MKQEERIELLTQVASGISKLMGDDTEVILHDLTKRKVAFLANNEITGRDKIYRINPAVCDAISNLADGEGHLIGYGSKAANGKKLRSSHFMFVDEDNEPAAMLCVNQDTAGTEAIIDYLQKSIRLRSMDETEEERNSSTVLSENYIIHVTQQVINNTIEQLQMDLTSKEAKLELLRRLKFQGVFDVKDAIPYVCNVMAISQATLYNYLRELRNEEAQEPINKLKQR